MSYDLLRFVQENNVGALRESLFVAGVNPNTQSPEDGSTALHYAAAHGNLECLNLLLQHPQIKIDVQNNEGNTPLHVATAYTRLQAIKILLDAGNYVHSIHITNIKSKKAIDYASNMEVRSYLETYMNCYQNISHMNDVEWLKKQIVDIQMNVNDFQDKCRDTIRQLIEQKHVAVHKANLLEQAAGIKDKSTAESYINKLSYLQDENERLTADIGSYKHRIQLLERTINQQSEEMQQAQSIGKEPGAPHETADSALSKLQEFEEQIKRQDELDEQSGLVVFVRGEGGVKHLKGGTKEKLVERLTVYGSNFDLQYLQAFLLTYRAFMKPIELFQLLTQHYENAQALPVRLRVCNTIKYWMENYWFDFGDDKNLNESLKYFIQTKMVANQDKLAKQLTRVLEKKESGIDDNQIIQAPINGPKPLWTKKGNKPRELQRSGSMLKDPKLKHSSVSVANLESKFKNLMSTKVNDEDNEFSILDIDPLEIARQLTLIEFSIFRKIKPTEFLDQAWLSKDKETIAPNVSQMTSWSNRVSKWVITEIVTSDNVKNRAALYERFVLVAQHLDKLKNFNGAIEILTALQSSPIYRLKDTLQCVTSRVRKLGDELMREFSSELNYKKLRSRVHASDPPLIPFPGVYLQDLVFLDAGSKSYIDVDKKLINFQKHMTTARYIQELLNYQNQPFALEPVPEIQDWLKTVHVIMSEDEHYNLSLECEPRTQ